MVKDVVAIVNFAFLVVSQREKTEQNKRKGYAKKRRRSLRWHFVLQC